MYLLRYRSRCFRVTTYREADVGSFLHLIVICGEIESAFVCYIGCLLRFARTIPKKHKWQTHYYTNHNFLRVDYTLSLGDLHVTLLVVLTSWNDVICWIRVGYYNWRVETKIRPNNLTSGVISLYTRHSHLRLLCILVWSFRVYDFKSSSFIRIRFFKCWYHCLWDYSKQFSIPLYAKSTSYHIFYLLI